jgi:hypothetical protein
MGYRGAHILKQGGKSWKVFFSAAQARLARARSTPDGAAALKSFRAAFILFTPTPS